MHILDTVILYDRTEGSSQTPLPLSSFRWNKEFLQSCQAGNLKSLNLNVYFSLKHPSSKRLYRFLDKRFNGSHKLKPEPIFPLEEIAITRVGLSPNYAKNVGKLKEKLQPAIDELEQIGFLAPMTRPERYRKDAGQWMIHFLRPVNPAGPAKPEKQPEPALPPLVTELVARGISEKVAATLVQKHGEEAIRLQVEILDWRLTGKKADKIDDPAAWLVAAIKEPHSPPKGFVSKAERQQREEAKQAQERQAAEERRRKREAEAREDKLKQAVNAYWASLTPAQQAELDAACDALADAETLANEKGPHQDTFRLFRRRAYIQQLLESREPVEA